MKDWTSGSIPSTGKPTAQDAHKEVPPDGGPVGTVAGRRRRRESSRNRACHLKKLSWWKALCKTTVRVTTRKWEAPLRQHVLNPGTATSACLSAEKHTRSVFFQLTTKKTGEPHKKSRRTTKKASANQPLAEADHRKLTTAASGTARGNRQLPPFAAVNNCVHTLAVLVLCIFSTCRAFRHFEVFLSRCSFCQVFYVHPCLFASKRP